MKKQYQLSEFNFYDGEAFITFNLIDINFEKKEITVGRRENPISKRSVWESDEV